jgi:hypothetical protein
MSVHLQAFWVLTRRQMAAFIASPRWSAYQADDQYAEKYGLQEMAACGDQLSIYPEKPGWFGSAVVPYNPVTRELPLIARAEVTTGKRPSPLACLRGVPLRHPTRT